MGASRPGFLSACPPALAILVAGILVLSGMPLATAQPAPEGAAPATATSSARSSSTVPTSSEPPNTEVVPTTTSKVSRPHAATAAPQVVPPATGNDAVITVKTGGDRVSADAIAPLPGVTLHLYDGSTAPTTPVADSWATCVSDSDGDCSFTVPNTQLGGVNRDRRFWVVETGVPAGWFGNPALVTGPDGGPFTSRQYTFQTGAQLRNGATYATTGSQDFMRGTGNGNASASGGIWQHSRVNPTQTAQCGVRIALIVDVSGSVEPSLDDLKSAADDFVDSLTGTPSSVALYTFNRDAPANDTNNQNRPLTAVSTAAGGATVKSYIDGLSASSNTNWDRGIYQAAVSTTPYDIAVVITDGNPTVYTNSPAQGPGNFTRFREVENGIASANALKAKGTRIVAVGVGAGIADGADNLRSISGPTVNSDYYQTANYAQAARNLQNLAGGTCQGTLTVIKEVVPPGGSPSDAVVAGGWTMTASNPSSGVTLATAATAVTRGGSGGVNFGLTFGGGATVGQLTVTETQQQGYTLLPQGGANAACRRTDTDAPTPVSDDGALGFRATVSSNYPVTCVVLNEAPEPPATVQLNKVWNINGTVFPEGTQPPDFVAQARLNGTAVAWGNVRTGFLAGQTPNVAEDPVTFAATRPGCSLDSSRLTSSNGAAVNLPLPQTPTLTGGDNTFTVTNTVTCVTRLRLVKQVSGGTASPDAWTLEATKTDAGDVTFTSGTSGVQGVITSNDAYVLSETGGDPAYRAYVNPTATLTPGASGSWSCVELAADGITVIPGYTDGINGQVTARRGAFVQCTAVNETATLRLRKTVENTYGGTAVPADWSLTATPVNPPAGVGPQTVTGSTTYASLEVYPGVTYRLTESGGPSGYALRDITCSSDEGQPTLTTQIAVGAGGTGSCTFANVDQPAQLTLRKIVAAGSSRSTKSPADWTLTAVPQGITGQSTVTGDGDPTDPGGVSSVEVSAGTYALGETGPTGFTAGAWSCDGGTVSGSNVSVPLGATVVCQITNTAISPTLTLVKQVVNDDGGVAVATDWTLTASGPTPLRGRTGESSVTGVTVAVGTYTLGESGPGGYTASAWVCTGASVDAGAVTLAEGDDATCTVTNNDNPASWTLAKTSDPVPGSIVTPGSVVTYTLTVTNTGARPVTQATVSDDMSHVLDHATLRSMPTGAVMSGSTLTWTVPTLAGAGDIATLTYSVRVDDSAVNAVLTNVATPSAVGGTCLACKTVHGMTTQTTPQPTASPSPSPSGGSTVGPLPDTGGPGMLPPLLGLALVLGGAAILTARRLRRR